MSITAYPVKKILMACRILDRKGLVEGYGHVSVRLPDKKKILITARKALGLVKRRNDIILVEIGGTKQKGKYPPPYELPMHLSIYRRRPDVGSIVRTHSPNVLVLGVLGETIRPVHGFGSFLGKAVPVYEKPDLIHTDELGEELAEVLGSNDAVVLRGNGSLTVGKSLEEACVKALFLEEAASTQYRALCIKEPLFFTEEEIRRRTDVHYDHYGRAWEYYAAKYGNVSRRG